MLFFFLKYASLPGHFQASVTGTLGCVTLKKMHSCSKIHDMDKRSTKEQMDTTRGHSLPTLGICYMQHYTLDLVSLLSSRPLCILSSLEEHFALHFDSAAFCSVPNYATAAAL